MKNQPLLNTVISASAKINLHLFFFYHLVYLQPDCGGLLNICWIEPVHNNMAEGLPFFRCHHIEVIINVS